MNLNYNLSISFVAWTFISASCNPGWTLPGDKELLITNTPLQAQFDPWIWEHAKQERYRMLGDLVNSQKLIGKTRNQVHALLNEPVPTNDYDKEGTSINSDTYSLNVTRCGNAGMEYLDINYKNDRVKSIRARCAEQDNPTLYGTSITKNPPRLAGFDDLPKLKRIEVKPENQERHRKVTQI